MLSRRKFLIGSSQAFGLAVLSPFLPLATPVARAQSATAVEEPKHYFIHVRANFGMHSPMGLDPIVLNDLYKREMDPVEKTNAEFYAAYKDSDITKTKGGILLGIGAKPLEAVIDDICIVNGILMLPNDVSHENNRKYMSSGMPASNSPFFAFQLMLNKPTSSSLGVVYSVEQDDQTFNLGPSTQISKVSGGAFANTVIEERYAVEKDVGGMTAAVQKIMSMDNRASDIKELTAQYTPLFEDASNENFAAVAAGLNAGLFSYSIVDLSNLSLDTHTNHATQQPASQILAFTKFASLIRGLKSIPSLAHGGKSSLYDNSTIILTSDFARTSYANSNGDGTDHNPFNNSTVIAGGRIKGGQVIGRSTIIPAKAVPEGRSRLMAVPFDFKTAKNLSYEDFKKKMDVLGNCKMDQKDCVDFIKPSHIYTSLSLNFGLKNGTGFVKDRQLPGLLKG